MSYSDMIIVDGANVAYAERSANGQPKISNLVAMRNALEERGYRPIIIVDASLRHDIDDPDQLEVLLNQGAVRQAPADTDADYFVIALAKDENSQIVTNDEYSDYRERNPDLGERRVPFMIVNGQVEFYERDLQPPDQ